MAPTHWLLGGGALVLAGCLHAPPAPTPAHGVLQEVWLEVTGDTVADLTAHPRYAGPSDTVRLLDRFESANLGVNYGHRLTALLAPPQTGDYTFWLASDDGSELWLGPADQPDDRRRIATVDGWVDTQAWDTQPGQKSAPVQLQAGTLYTLQALHKQGGGGNHVAVAWQSPGGQRQPVPPDALRPPVLEPATAARLAQTRRDDDARLERRRQAEACWSRGVTLPADLAAGFAVSTEGLPDPDTGVNVLVDQAHQTSFAVLWGLRGQLRASGFRACSSGATLSHVLTPGTPCRVRVAVDDLEPFAWWPAAEFNVVLTSQQDLNAQPYTPAEQQALNAFLAAGGGLLVIGARPRDPATADAWSLNAFLAGHGARYTQEPETRDGNTWAGLALDATWEPLLRGDGGRPIRARRTVGRGRLLLAEGVAAFAPDDKESADRQDRKRQDLRQGVAWLAGGKPPAGGNGRLPQIGGIGIFPELEKNLGGIVVYYAANQKPEVVQCIEQHIPRAARLVSDWFPTKVYDEPYTIVICAGTGGGWAINPRPKAAAVIAYDSLGILGVFAHEMAHTMGGPRNARDELAGLSPHHNQGEAHAGWFQGKVQAVFGDVPDKANRNCNSILELEAKKGAQLDLATEHETEAGRAKWGKGPEWTKLWYVFQKLDDRYGPTWYPRWYWVRNSRWLDEPGHRETWDEMVEDMSIAVGEDLFPFFRRIGTTLGRQRLEHAAFQGRTLELPEAPIPPGPAGKVCLDPIGDYTQPLKPRP